MNEVERLRRGEIADIAEAIYVRACAYGAGRSAYISPAKAIRCAEDFHNAARLFRSGVMEPKKGATR